MVSGENKDSKKLTAGKTLKHLNRFFPHQTCVVLWIPQNSSKYHLPHFPFYPQNFVSIHHKKHITIRVLSVKKIPIQQILNIKETQHKK